MGHVSAVAIKLTLVAFVLLTVFSLMYGYVLWNTLVLTFIVTGIAYVIGDLWILKMTNNLISTIADVGIGTLSLWIIGPFVLNEPVSFFLALISAVIIAVGEWFFHKYVDMAVFRRGEKRAYHSP
ncbi:DUF2512 family protein [Aliibacillus thermotolerans]|uniref:DUF2512 family protein n=1 Tax=Aliibacillus thermotolerans TaxID=1834418 RepID=A0ABW0UA16_9BACI|nr:DUF2512 family protein [Aliibacillus thermotolerans]MDA3129361.1 DUF2512 family protein [Aliibacillus thermotolerans]